MLKIEDLNCSKELAREEMNEVIGGTSPQFAIDFSSGMESIVNDVNQLFAFEFVQANTGVMSNNQTFIGSSGLNYAPVNQEQNFKNTLTVSEVGPVSAR